MKKSKTKILTALFAAIATIACGLLAVSPSVMADGEVYDGTYLLNKTLSLDLYQCYTNGYISQEVSTSEFIGVNSILSGKKESDGTVKLPNGFTRIEDDDLKCSELIAGYKPGGDTNSFDGILSYSNVTPVTSNNSSSEIGGFLEKFGYSVDNNSTERSQCAYITFTVTQWRNGAPSDQTSYRTNRICAYVDNNGTIVSNNNGISLYENGDGATQLGEFGGVGFMDDGTFNAGDSVLYSSCSKGQNFSQCVRDIKLNQVFTVGNVVSGNYTEFINGNINVEDAKTGPQSYSISSFSVAGSNAMRNLFGSNSKNLSPAEVVSLYQNYLNTYADVQCTGPASSYYGPFHAIVNGEYVENCYAKQTTSLRKSTKFYGYANSKWGAELDFNELIDYLKNTTVSGSILSSVTSLNVREMGDDVDDPGTIDGGDQDCYSSSSSLGWILCPIIETTANAVNGLYEKIIEPFLVIQASTFDTNSGVYQGWQTFQSIANVVFVILFLVTIFSQLTGIGIDNLGIKRILPKLIVAAILVNLSYIICQALVDLSNIIGYGANHFFDNIDITSTEATSGEQSAIATLLSIIGLGGVATIAGATAPIWGPTMVIPILLTLVSLLISLVFAFVLLGLRQAGVIVLVLVAPVAFVFYMLPNTKPIFDKWKKAFTGLLLLYPICGLLMGGARFAGDVVASTSNGFWATAIGSLLSVIVFFFIPTLVRSSMSAIGNVGVRISNLRQSASRGAQQRAANSQLAKDYQTRMSAGIDRNGNLTARGRMISNLASGKSRFSKVPGLQRIASISQARNIANYQKMQDEIDFASRPDLIASEAEAKRFNRGVEAYKSRHSSSGVVNNIGDIKDDSFDAGMGIDNFAEGTMTRNYIEAAERYSQAVQSGDKDAQRDAEQEMYAYTTELLANGHHGAQGLRNVIKTLEASGNNGALRTLARAAKADRNLGDLKGGARSTFDYLNDAANGVARGGIDNYVERTNFANMSEAQLFNTDNEELARYAKLLEEKRKEQARLSAEGLPIPENIQFGDLERALMEQAKKAYNNDRLRGGAKKSRQKLVADIAGIPLSERHDDTDSIQIDHAVNNSKQDNNNGGESTFENGSGI